MEFERTLFRVHEKFLSIDQVHRSIDYCFKASILILIITTPIFLYGNYRFLNQSACLQPHVLKNYVLDPHNMINLVHTKNTLNVTDGTNTTGQIDSTVDLNATNPAVDKIPETGAINDTSRRMMAELSAETVIKPGDIVYIKVADLSIEGLDLNNPNNLYSFFEFSGSPQVLLMDSDIRNVYNFTQHNITLDIRCYSTSIFGAFVVMILNFENILMNEMIVTFNGFDRYMKNDFTTEIWSFSEGIIQRLMTPDNIIEHCIKRFFGILQLLMGLFLVSSITSIYNKMTIICAPIFILAACGLVSRPNQNQIDRENIYRAFPWIGMYLHTLNISRRNKDRYIIFAFICMIMIFYCLYLAALVFWTLLIFGKSFPKGLDENFYAFLALVEFLVLLFLRTRTTIKFFPKMSITIMLMFLYYVQYTPYGFYNMALFMTSWAILGILSYLLLNFEIPAVNWNPSYHYTPSLDSPRTLYSPLFSLTWYHDLPHLWTMFFPIYGRSYFTNTELAMVDRNYPLLVSTLENAAQGGPAINNQFQPQAENPINPGNGFGFEGQAAGNVAENQNDNSAAAVLDENRPNPGAGQPGSSPNLLNNTDSDYILDIPEDEQARRNAWRQNNQNTGSNYRRIDDEV